jgi:uncharacterized membrane protein YfcA
VGPILPGAEGALLDVLILLVLAAAAGAFGALVGLGGGLFIVPILVVVFEVDIHLAVAASLVSVVGTSLGSASTHVEAGLTDVRVGMFLETATAVGGLLGAIVAVTILAAQDEVLILAFVPVVLGAGFLMPGPRSEDVQAAPPPDRWADRLKLHGSYYNVRQGRPIEYRVTRTRDGLVLTGISGFGSGLLGIGGGLFNVPAMHGFMNLPIRVAATTSSFMIGVTAVAGAVVYLFAGDMSLPLLGPVVLGTTLGSFLGTRAQPRFRAVTLRTMFLAILPVAAGLMLLRGLGVLG